MRAHALTRCPARVRGAGGARNPEAPYTRLWVQVVDQDWCAARALAHTGARARTNDSESLPDFASL